MADIQIRDQEFEERYRPILTPSGAWRDFDWTDPAEKRLIDIACDERRLWTTVEGDTGFLLLISGWHFVNRLGYVITARPYESDDDMMSVYDPEDLEDWEERIASEWAEELSGP